MAVIKTTSKSKPWRVDYRVNGKRVRKSFTNKRQAEAFERDQLSKRDAGTWVDPRTAERTTVTDVWNDFQSLMETTGPNGRGPTKERARIRYEYHWRAFIEPVWGATPVAYVKHEEVSAWVASMKRRSGGTKQGEMLDAGAHILVDGTRKHGLTENDPRTVLAGESTRKSVAVSFKTLMKHAVRMGVVHQNPALNAAGESTYTPAAKTKKDHVYLTMEQLFDLYRALPEAYRLIALVSGLCGLRWGEANALKASDVDLEGRVIHVQRAYQEVEGHFILGLPKSGQDRRVPIPEVLIPLLRERMVERPTGLLFSYRAGGQPMRNTNYNRRTLRPALEKMKANGMTMPDMSFHDLRHTAVSLMIRSGANIKVVQAIAGHATATLTLDTYAGLFMDDLMDSVGRLDQAIKTGGHFMDTEAA